MNQSLSKKEKVEPQGELFLLGIGIVGCLLLAGGVWVVFGWGWSLITVGMALLLTFAFGVLGLILEDFSK